MIVFRSVKSLCSAQPITEDAKEANEQSRAGNTRDSFHFWENVRNTMTTDWSQDSCGATRERPSKVLCTQLIQKYTGGNFLLFVLRIFVKNVVTVQATNNVKRICRVKGHGGKQKITLPSKRKRKERSAIVPACLIDFIKTSAESG